MYAAGITVRCARIGSRLESALVECRSLSAKIASTVHDTFHAFMLSELDHHGMTTPELFENINLRLAHSVTARNALGLCERENAREIATMLYGELHPYGYFRFVNFGHPPPLVFSAEYRKFVELDKDRMVQFLPLGLQIPADHPDRKRYFSMRLRSRPANSSDIAEITLIARATFFFFIPMASMTGATLKNGNTSKL